MDDERILALATRWGGARQPALLELERRLVVYAVAELGGAFTVGRLYAEKLEQPLHSEPWDEAAFNAWVEAYEEAEALIEMSGEVCFWCGCLCDALEIVDWRSGEIRDREINQWLLDETIKGLRPLDHPRVQKLVTYLEGQREALLTFLDWLADWPALSPMRKSVPLMSNAGCRTDYQ